MSMVISTVTAASVVLLTDGAIYDAKNVITDVRRKVATSDRVPIAVAARGSVLWGDHLSGLVIRMVEDFGFDAAMLALAKQLPKNFKLEEDNANRFELLIAGISEARGPTHLLFHNCAPISLGRPGLVLAHPGQTFVGAFDNSGQSLADIGVRKPFPGETAQAYYSVNGVAIAQSIREVLAPASDLRAGDAAYIVGGQLDMTVVTQAGATTRTMHRWDDKIGERINPFADRRTVVPMSREQRRAAASIERRKASA